MRNARYALVRTLTLAVVSLVCVALLASPGWSVVWTEGPDAGDQISTAQSTAGSGALTQIDGTISTPNDKDLYCVRIVDASAFFADMICVVIADPDIWLFASSGNGVAHNDGCAASQTPVTGALVSTTGIYYIGVTHDAIEARNAASQSIWNPPPVSAERAPDGPGAPGPLDSWTPSTLNFINLAYTVRLAGCEPCDTATPVSRSAWGRIKVMYR